MTNWHVLGAGALGSLWAAGLARSGHQVELLLKNEDRLALFQSLGAITYRYGDHQENIPVSASITRTGATDIDHLLVTTKAHQTLDALNDIASRLTRNCRALFIQNGMGVAERIVEKFPDLDLYCGVTTDGAWCPQPFSVIQAAAGETMVGGCGNCGDAGALVEDLPVKFLEINSCDNIIDRQWQKLAVNCAVNGLTAIYRCRNGDLLTNKDAAARLKRLCEEIAQLGTFVGHDEWIRELYPQTESVIRLTAENFSSMYQDVHNGRTTEIDFLNGYLIGKAKEYGIECPENEAVYHEIKRTEGLYERPALAGKTRSDILP